MSTLEVILVVIGALIVIGLIAFALTRGRARRHAQRREEARGHREEAATHRARAEAEQAEADELEARARHQTAEAQERARAAEAERKEAREHTDRAESVDPGAGQGDGEVRGAERARPGDPDQSTRHER
jgi:FtsZ-interacting cell division protein ZipA